MNHTKIEWCDLTVNPIVGCSKCSPGCDNCYAERIAAMRVKHPNPKISEKYAGTVDNAGKWIGKTNFDVSCLVNLPKTSKRIFVGSMGDLFHDSVMDSHLEHIMGHIGLTQSNAHHTFMLLTKRPERMREFFTRWKPYREVTNVWLGVTVCNQAEADEKIPVLLQTPAAKRFVSVEPMLGQVDIGKYLYGCYECALSCGTKMSCTEYPEAQCQSCGFTGPDNYETWGDGNGPVCPECGRTYDIDPVCPDCGTYMVQEHPDTPCIDWVICGAETGLGKRFMAPSWALALKEQCHAWLCSRTPFFFKKDSNGSRLLDDREYSEVPV